MSTETTRTNPRANVAGARRRGQRDVALVPGRELAGLVETIHLLGSPRNARRLFSALGRAERKKTKPVTVAELRREMFGGAGE